ncbi:hypothetical protein [Agromyces arachidis]|uniref:hypothetical protein n=1 Tax=Agromyces arachidis TaxID=766966 RepID=UPI00405696C8
MKRILATGFIVGLATVGLAAAPAQAAGHSADCFGGIHKLINTEGYMGFTNVGQVVQALGGQGKNDTARDLCD